MKSFTILKILLFAVLVLFITGCVKAPTEPTEDVESESPEYFVGVCSHITRPSDLHASDFDNKEETIDMVKNSGMGFIRTGFKWRVVQPQQHTWNWKEFDAVVSEAKSDGVGLLALVQGPPLWAYPAHEYLDEWLVYLDRLVERYGGYIKHWEIWNEPNVVSGKYWPQDALPDEYAELVIASAELIKQKQPESTVLLGGLATGPKSNPFGLWEGLFQLGVLDYVDGVAFHPYPHPGAGLFEFDSQLRDLIAQYSDDEKELWATEFGRRSGEPNLHYNYSYEFQKDEIMKTILAFWADQGKYFFIFKFNDHRHYDPKTAQQINKNDKNAFYGITTIDLLPKSAFTAVERLSKKLNESVYVDHTVFEDNGFLVEVVKENKSAYFGWGESAINEIMGLYNDDDLSVRTYNKEVQISEIGQYFDEILFWEVNMN